MKIITAVFVVIFAIGAMNTVIAQNKDLAMLAHLSSLQWQNRIFIVNEIVNKIGDENTAKIFEKHIIDIDDRDIIWFVIKEDQISTNYLGMLAKDFLKNTLEQYKIDHSEVIMIGKDGGIKSRSNYVDVNDLFSKIDAMPMRQSEMRK